jgi:hypothetical protein
MLKLQIFLGCDMVRQRSKLNNWTPTYQQTIYLTQMIPNNKSGGQEADHRPMLQCELTAWSMVMTFPRLPKLGHANVAGKLK